MIPDINQFETDGEWRFFKFLESHAKPDNKYVSWYSPDVEEKKPDFVLFSRELGLLILEVKDWALDQILEVYPHYFIVKKGGKAESNPNPLQQARSYRISLIEKIRNDGRLVSKDPKHHGNPKIPINCGVVFPNINRDEYVRKELLKDEISPQRVFFLNDLHPESNICRDRTGKCFFEAINQMFSRKFRFNITEHEYKILKSLLHRGGRLHEPERSSIGFAEQYERLRILDDYQERLARKYDGGHRIICGPSGTGKTMVLVHKVSFLKKYNPAIKRILFVCYNITLVNYIKRLLSEKQVGLGDGGVEVYHFYELCSKILDTEIEYEKQEGRYYEDAVELTLLRLEDEDIKYDAILVDEGQDFSDDMYKVVTSLLNKDTNSFTIVLDEDQNLYRRKLSWKEVGVQARGRVHKLSYVYRNTIETSRFANSFIEKYSEQDESAQLELFPDSFDFHGPEPEMKRHKSIEETVSYVTDKIDYLANKEEFPFSEIAIIYAKKSFKDEEIRSLPKMFGEALSSKGIMHYWASEDYRSKRSYDITTDSVTISTIHSTKGLDYACVFLVGLDSLEPDGWDKHQIRNMTNVAIRRARYCLFIPYTKENEVISRLLSCLRRTSKD